MCSWGSDECWWGRWGSGHAACCPVPLHPCPCRALRVLCAPCRSTKQFPFFVGTDDNVLHLTFYYLMNLNVMTVKAKVTTAVEMTTAISAG